MKASKTIDECLKALAAINAELAQEGLSPKRQQELLADREVWSAELSAAERGYYNYPEQQVVTRKGNAAQRAKIEAADRKATTLRQRLQLARARICDEVRSEMPNLRGLSFDAEVARRLEDVRLLQEED